MDTEENNSCFGIAEIVTSHIPFTARIASGGVTYDYLFTTSFVYVSFTSEIRYIAATSLQANQTVHVANHSSC